MRSTLVLISGLAFLVIVSVVAIRLFDHYSEVKDELIEQLPKPPAEPRMDAVVVRIDSEGLLFMGTDRITESQLAASLAKLAMSDGSRRVHLETEENTPLEAYTTVLDACAKAGISNVSSTSRLPDDAP